MRAVLCDYCKEQVTDRTAGPEGLVHFEHQADRDADELDFHRRCLDELRNPTE